MNNIKLVIEKCLQLFSIRLSVGGFSFSLLEVSIGLTILSVAICFIHYLFD